MGLKKQDMNGVRTPLDVERRHNLGAIPGLEKDVSDLQEEVIVDSQLSSSSTHAVQNKVITQNFTSLSNNKVDKVTGKGLSSNDFTDSEKEILDMITLQKIQQWDSNSFSIDLVYPVGSIYMSVNNTDPSTLFSGTTWQQIKDTFLLSAGDTYTAGTTGGEAAHTLTTNEIPSHNHNMTFRGVNATAGTTGEPGSYPFKIHEDVSQNWSINNYWEMDNTGGGQAHNNMPPYLVVYMWKRTA